jgi:hypothetical protein
VKTLPSDQDLPIFLETHAAMFRCLDESPWSPELLEDRVLIEETDKPPMAMSHALALVTPTQLMEVIGDGGTGE